MNDQQIVDFATLSNFQPKQLEAENILLNTDCKYLLYGGAAAGGKSYFLRWIAVELGLYYAQKYGIRNIPIGLFSEDYPTLKDRQIARIKREMPPWLGELKESRDEGYVFQVQERFGGSRILLRNLDDPSKYASTEFAAICVEELTKNPKDTFDDLRFRLRFPGIPDPKFVGATNPGGIGHGWVKKYWVDHDIEEDQEKDLFKFVQAKVTDNSYIASAYIKQLESLPESKRKAFLDGSWDVFEGQVFGEFNRNYHICPLIFPKATLPKYGGMDWGRSAPFVTLFAVMREEKWEGKPFNRLVVYKEIDGTEKSPKEWATIIKERQHIEEVKWIRGDPAMFTKGNDNSISIADQFKMEGVTIQPASNERLGGWELIHNWLRIAPDGLPYILFTENCRNLIRTLPQLVYDENKIEDVDTDTEDHWADALRYLVKHLKWINADVGVTHKGKRVVTDAHQDLRKQKTPIKFLDLDAFVK